MSLSVQDPAPGVGSADGWGLAPVLPARVENHASDPTPPTYHDETDGLYNAVYDYDLMADAMAHRTDARTQLAADALARRFDGYDDASDRDVDEETCAPLQYIHDFLVNPFCRLECIPDEAPFPTNRVNELECLSDDHQSFCNTNNLDSTIPFDDDLESTFVKYFSALQSARKSAFDAVRAGTTYDGTRSIA